VLWSFSFGIIKYGLPNLDSFFISYTRNLIALVFFSFVSIYQLKQFKWDIQLIAIGAIQFGLMYIFYIQSYQYLPAYLIAAFTITTPIFISIIDKYFFKNRFTYKEFLAIFLVILGSYLMKYNMEIIEYVARDWSPEYGISKISKSDYWFAFLLIQFSNFFFALGQIWFKYWNRKNININIVANFSQLFLGATLITFISYSLFGGSSNEISDTNLSALLFLGFISSGIGFLLWNVGAIKVSSERLAVVNNLIIPIAILNSLTFFGESIDFSLFLPGIALFYIAYRIT
tara:strand:- start:58 stop:918 length:861 start_codon:yes stop_codon:yes gene_type:complete